MPRKKKTKTDPGKMSRDKSSPREATAADKRRNGGRKDERKFSDRETDQRSDPRNDISWYSRYPELLVAAASVPYPFRPGMQIAIGKDLDPNATRPTLYYKVPGVLSIHWAPSCGWSEDVTSPASIACKELYGRVRKAYSGRLYADPPDFLIYLLALDSIFAYIGSLKRLYRVINAYTPNNYALPVELANHLGLSNAAVAGLQADRMQFYGAINTLVNMTAKFTCPAVMDIFNRHYWMNDNVYTDANSPSGQMYVFVMDYVYKFAMANTPQGVPAGGLQAVPTSGSYDTVDKMLAFGQQLIEALAASEDAYTISGYLMRAFEGEPAFSVAKLEYDEKLDLVYEPEVLSQIENATALWDGNSQGLSINITQDPTTNSIISRPTVTYASTTPWIVNKVTPDTFGLLINMHNDAPTVADTVIATRLKTYMVQAGSAESFAIKAGTEIVTGMFMSQFDSTVGAITRLPHLVTTPEYMRYVFALEAFDWHPIVWTEYSVTISLEGQPPKVTLYRDFAWDVANLTTVDREVLDNINRVCIYSEFNAFNI